MAVSLGNVVLKIGADLKSARSGLDSLKRNIIGPAALVGAIQLAGKAMNTLQRAGEMAFSATVVKAAEFRAALSEVNTLGVQDIEGLRDVVLSASDAFGTDLIDSVKAAYQAISAGVDEVEMPQVLEASAKAAAAGVSELSTAVDLGTTIVNAFGKSVGDIDEVFGEAFIAVREGKTTFGELASSVGRVAPLFAATTGSSEEMFASIARLTKAGISTSEAVSGLKVALSNIQKPGQEAIAVAEGLEIQLGSAALESKGLFGVLDDMKDKIRENVPALFDQVEALTKNNEELSEMKLNLGEAIAATEKQIAHNKLHGASTDQLKEKLKSQKDQYNKLGKEYRQNQKELKDLTLTSDNQTDALAKLFGSTEALVTVLALMSSETISMAEKQTILNEVYGKFRENNPAEDFKIISQQVKNAAVRIGDLMLPVLGDLLEEHIQPIVEGIGDWIEKNDELVSKIFRNFGDAITKLLGILGSGREALEAFLLGGKNIAVWLAEDFPALVDAVVPWLEASLDGIVDNWKTKSKQLGDIFAVIKDMFRGFIDWLEGIDKVLSFFGMGFLGDLIDALKAFLPKRGRPGPGPDDMFSEFPDELANNRAATMARGGGAGAGGGGVNIAINMHGVTIGSDMDLHRVNMALGEELARRMMAMGMPANFGSA